MNIISILFASIACGMATPETSSLFVKHVDEHSGAVSYILKPKAFAYNQQSLYFTAKSMTDDGRFLVFDVSGDEFRDKNAKKQKAVIDFKYDKVIFLPNTTGTIPFLDLKTDQLYYGNNEGIIRHDLKDDPTKQILVCPWPKAYLAMGKQNRSYYTHLTLTQDRKKAFLDSQRDDVFFHGCLNLVTGEWEPWGTTEFICNHGQLCPIDDNLAMCAWEVDWVDSKGQHHPIPRGSATVRYPRLWYMEPNNKHYMIDPGPSNYATHECWDEDGRGHYWCGPVGFWHYDRFTHETTRISPFPAGHGNVTADKKYQTYDYPIARWWRGCAWNVQFRNAETGDVVFFHSYNKPLCPQNPGSRLHPDPHPHFVMNGKYIICTVNSADGHMDLSVTPVAPLIERTSRPTLLGKMPAYAHPVDVGERIGVWFWRCGSATRKSCGDIVRLAELLTEYSHLTCNFDLEDDVARTIGETSDAEKQKMKGGHKASADAIAALELVKSVKGGDKSKLVAAKEAWMKLAAEDLPEDKITVMKIVVELLKEVK